MKKLNYLFYVLLCLGITSCGGNGSDEKTANEDGVTTTSKPDTSKFVKVDSSTFFFDEIIDVKTARDMIDLYKVRRKDLIDTNYHIKDAKAVTFDLNKMQKFINRVKAAGSTQVRLYFGVYPAAGKYPELTTIIALGVKPDGTDVLIKKGSITKTDGLDPYNHGNLCPPGHDCASDN